MRSRALRRLELVSARGGGTIGSTVAALIMANQHFVGLWAGDSRIYRLRDGHIEMLSEDHSAVAEYVLAGKMTWDEAEQHPAGGASLAQPVAVDLLQGEQRRLRAREEERGAEQHHEHHHSERSWLDADRDARGERSDDGAGGHGWRSGKWSKAPEGHSAPTR